MKKERMERVLFGKKLSGLSVRTVTLIVRMCSSDTPNVTKLGM